MTFQQLILALPCHSLEDFPLYHTGESAEGLLAGWTCLWHPALIASAGGIVTWCRCDTPPEDVAGRLIVIPSVGASELPTGFAQRAKEQGAVVIRKQSVRAEMVAAALAELDGGDGGVPRELADDFFALGYCYLQVQLLTRQMRYASNLDEVHFKNVVVDAANSALRGDHAHARERLQACFNLLAEERDRYYPVEAFIVDLTLVGPTTMGKALREEIERTGETLLPMGEGGGGTTPDEGQNSSQDAAAEKISEDPHPNPLPRGEGAGETAAIHGTLNLLLSAETLTQLAAKEPATLAALKSAIEQNRASVVGGHYREGQTPLVARETLLDDLLLGLQTYEELLGARPTVYGRYRFGLSPALPQILAKLAFVGALHVPFEDGRMPEGSQFKVRWEGSDGAALDAIAKPPFDASKPETFLGLAVKMGESMDRDHVATICLAHWPGQASVWFDDLRRIAKYCPALGRFITLAEYFAKTDTPTQHDRHGADQYKAPYLKQQVIRRTSDPISSVMRYWRRRAAEQARLTLTTLATLVRGSASQPEAKSLAPRIDACLEDAAARTTDEATIDGELETSLAAAVRDLAQVIPTAKTAEQQGYLVFNPCSFVRRIGLTLPELAGLPEIARPIYAAADAGGAKHVVVDVPPLGFAWIAPASGAAKAAKKDILLAEGNALRNEYFEATINKTTGALQSIHEYNARANRMSQQVALRMGESDRDDENAVYSVMAADSVAVTASTTAMGEITSAGRLLDRKGKILARFVQKFQVWRGSRVMKMELEIEPLEELKSDPWNSYYCVRWAWSDEAAELARVVNESRFVTDAKRFEAPNYIEITDAKTKTTILTGGAPYHRRCEYRLLDAILLVRGDTNRKFTFGVGVELAQPLQDAIGLVTPPAILARESPPPTPANSSWLFHLDAKNVVATHWSPLVVDGRARGFRVRIAEIAGRPGQVALTAFRPVTKARFLDFRGAPLGDAPLDQGKIVLDLSASEWVYVEAEF